MFPTVSVLIINLNGKDYLEACLSSLLAQDYPADLIEIVLVDNGSQDGSSDLVATAFPMVHLIRNDENCGFAPAVNQAAEVATGEYLALLNNDAHADPGWLREMAHAMERHHERGVVCIGANMRDWEGQRIDFAVSGASFYGCGYQFFTQLDINAVPFEEQEILFACGGAMLVDRRVFLDLGGFDDDYFAYYEDVDFGWRLWVCGYRVLFCPSAIVYHRHHGVASRVPPHQFNTILERNALMTVIKNYDEENLYRLLTPSLLLLMQRFFAWAEGHGEIDWSQFQSFDLSGNAPAEPFAVSRMSLSYLAGLRAVMHDFAGIWQKRQHVQARRKRSDSEILPLFRYAMGPSYCRELVQRETIADAFGFRQIFAGVRLHRVLIISTDPLYENLAGPGIRAVEMARHLAPSCHVVLAAPRRADITIPGVACVAFDRGDQEAINSLASQAEVVILQGFTLYLHPGIQQMHKIIVVDLYDPFHLENLEFFKHHEREYTRSLITEHTRALNQQLRLGSFFICASERQRDLWLGALGSLGRLSPEAYARDPTFCSLIDVVPFGLSPSPPAHRQQVLKGVVPGIGAGDTVVLWGGGVWNWLDPLTVVRAMDIVRQQRPDLKLFFLGYHHPNPVDVPEMAVYAEVLALVDTLGLHQSVFFNDRWVPYDERANYLLEADVGVSAHYAHIETHFSSRTRILDYIWAGLPMVLSEGDALSEMVAERGLGYTVAIGDAAGFADALLRLAAQPERRQSYAPAFAPVRRELAWDQALKPLIAFCQQPRCAPDTGQLAQEEARRHRRVAELEVAIAQKDSHIAYLEGLIRRIGEGRVMRLLQWVKERRKA